MWRTDWQGAKCHNGHDQRGLAPLLDEVLEAMETRPNGLCPDPLLSVCLSQFHSQAWDIRRQDPSPEEGVGMDLEG